MIIAFCNYFLISWLKSCLLNSIIFSSSVTCDSCLIQFGEKVDIFLKWFIGSLCTCYKMAAYIALFVGWKGFLKVYISTLPMMWNVGYCWCILNTAPSASAIASSLSDLSVIFAAFSPFKIQYRKDFWISCQGRYVGNRHVIYSQVSCNSIILDNGCVVFSCTFCWLSQPDLVGNY